MAEQLRVHTVIPEDRSSVPSTTSSDSQPSDTRVPGDPTLLASKDAYTHMHIPLPTYTCTSIHIIKTKNNPFLKKKSVIWEK